MANDLRDHNLVDQQANALKEDAMSQEMIEGRGVEAKDNSSLLTGWNTLPNFVTYFRLILVVVFIVLCALAGSYGTSSVIMRFVATGVFALAAFTDKLDGYLARKRQEITKLGKLLDPIADKVLVNSALILLSIFAELSWWITIIFLVREVGITLMRMIVVRKSGRVIPASNLGKYKTFFQCLAITMLLLPVWSFGKQASLTTWQMMYYRLAFVAVGAALFYCLYSAAMYVYHVFRA